MTPSTAHSAILILTRHRLGTMVRATWKGHVIAESDKTIVVEGNHYFPPDTVNRDLLKDSSNHTTCPWKGQASYYTVVADGEENADAAWYYPDPLPDADALGIKNHVAFWKGVSVA